MSKPLITAHERDIIVNTINPIVEGFARRFRVTPIYIKQIIRASANDREVSR